jgi:hypothetical protein
VPRGQRDGSLRPYLGISRPEPLLFLLSSSSVVLTRLNGSHTHTHTHLSGIPTVLIQSPCS